MEKFHFNQSFATLGCLHLLHYMTFKISTLYSDFSGFYDFSYSRYGKISLRISTLYSDFDNFYAFSYCKVNSYFRTITILVQDMEKFHFNQSFATLGHPHLLHYMTFVF